MEEGDFIILRVLIKLFTGDKFNRINKILSQPICIPLFSKFMPQNLLELCAKYS